MPVSQPDFQTISVLYISLRFCWRIINLQRLNILCLQRMLPHRHCGARCSHKSQPIHPFPSYFHNIFPSHCWFQPAVCIHLGAFWFSHKTRRRGYPPSALRKLCELIGVTKAMRFNGFQWGNAVEHVTRTESQVPTSVIEFSLLENCVRDALQAVQNGVSICFNGFFFSDFHMCQVARGVLDTKGVG